MFARLPACPAGTTKTDFLALQRCLGAKARHLCDVVHLFGICPSGLPCLHNRARQWVRRALRQCHGYGQFILGYGLSVDQNGCAGGQRAGFIEHNRVHLGQTLNCGFMFDQHTPPEQTATGSGCHGRHGQTQRTGAGDDQHSRSDVQRGAQIKCCQIPPDKSQGRQDMHPRRIEFGGLVGQ